VSLYELKMKNNYIFKPNNKYEILTPSGFQSFGGIRKLSKDKHYEITFSNGKFIKCSTTHKFISNDTDISADILNVGDYIDGDDGGSVNVVDKKIINSGISLFDIVEVSGGNIFNVDGIVSHNCDFISSGDTVIDPELLMFYKETYIQEPIERGGFDGNLWKWEYPEYTKSYMVVADVARGDGSDYSAAHVVDIVNAAQVAEYRGKLDTKDFGNFLVSLATEYNDALLVIENANVGWAAIQQVINRGYKNLFYMSKDLKYVDVEHQLHNRYRAEERGMVAGFSTTSKTRPLIISKLDEYFKEKTVIIRSIRLIDELFTFIFINGRAEAMRGYNDDLVMSFSIALWIRDTALRLRQEGIDLTKKALSGISTNTYDGMYSGTNDMVDDPWKIRIGDTVEDLKWLL
jgi:hypothetical protein